MPPTDRDIAQWVIIAVAVLAGIGSVGAAAIALLISYGVLS